MGASAADGGHQRVPRLIRATTPEGGCKRRWCTTTGPDPDAERVTELIQRHFGRSNELDRRDVRDMCCVVVWRLGRGPRR